MFEHARCWVNGQLVPAEQASVSVFDHGFLYGDGIFEGVRFYNKRAFRLPLHLKRLQRSAAALQLKLPSEEVFTQAVYAVIEASDLQDGYLRIIATRGVGVLGINPATCKDPGVIVIADQLQMVSDAERAKGIRAIITSTRRSQPDRLDPRIKSLNYLTSIFARMEANFAGVEEGILLNDRGCVAEGTAENIFIMRDGELLTPAPTEGALSGITRGTVLDLAKELAIPTKETVLTPYDLYCADECFFTGTGARLIPVREIDGRTIKTCPGEAYTRLAAAFAELVQRETAA